MILLLNLVFPKKWCDCGENIIICVSLGDLQNADKEIKKCLIDSFKKTDEEFLAEASKVTPSLKDGCTAVALLVVNDVIFSGNLGDSRAVLCRKDQKTQEYKCVQLTKDHTPANVSVCRKSMNCLVVCSMLDTFGISWSGLYVWQKIKWFKEKDKKYQFFCVVVTKRATWEADIVEIYMYTHVVICMSLFNHWMYILWMFCVLC